MKREIINSENAPTPIGPYAHANKVGNFVFISGQLPVDPVTGELKTSIKEATKMSLKNAEAILKDCGSSISDVVKTTVFLKNLDDFKYMNEVYSEYFSENPPARSCVQVGKLPMDAVVEIELIALLK